jgi:hypothetical protein
MRGERYGDQRRAKAREAEHQGAGKGDRDEEEQLPLPAEELAQIFTAGLSE